MDYTVELTDGLPRPLEDVESDVRGLGSDARHHLSEMAFLGGDASVEYGGEEPWVHEWRGTICPDKLPEDWVRPEMGFEEKIERCVDNLMTFFDNSCTPHNTGVDDFDWSVRVSEQSSNLRPEGTYSIQVVWEPK